MSVRLDGLESVLFDFHGTLSCGHYFARLGAETEARISALLFGVHGEDWANPWMAGQRDAREICGLLADHLTLDAADVHCALREGCANMALNPGVLRLAHDCRARGLKIGLVTVNMDVFSEIVVPAHGLDDLFDVIVNSADHGVLDKEPLWDAAFDALGAARCYGGSLVIDDSLANVERFRELGGTAHHYVGGTALWRIGWAASKEEAGPSVLSERE